MAGGSGRNVGPDGGAQGQHQRQQRKALHLRPLFAIGVQHDVGEAPVPPVVQVHEQERQIIEGVDDGEGIIEFDGVEQDGLAVVKSHVAQVQVAVAPTDMALVASSVEQTGVAVDGLQRCIGQGFQRIGVNDIGHVEAERVTDCPRRWNAAPQPHRNRGAARSGRAGQR